MFSIWVCIVMWLNPKLSNYPYPRIPKHHVGKYHLWILNYTWHKRPGQHTSIIRQQVNNRLHACQEHSAVKAPGSFWHDKASNKSMAAQTGWTHRLRCSFWDHFPHALNLSDPLAHSASIVLYLACALSHSLGMLQNGWMQREERGEREREKRGSKWDPDEMPRCVSGEVWGMKKSGLKGGEWLDWLYVRH